MAGRNGRAQNRKGRSKGRGRFVQLLEAMMRTEAWRDLNCTARQAYVELLRRYNGSNNGRIPFSVRELAGYLNVSESTAWRAVKTLREHGFVDVAVPGAFSRKVRHATEWRLTEHHCDRTNRPATRDFERWRKSEHGSTRETERCRP